MTDAQLELSLESLRHRSSQSNASRPPANRRRWWFERMREVVERARDWHPAPLPRPEQTSFTPLYRQVAITALAETGGRTGREEQLVCE